MDQFKTTGTGKTPHTARKDREAARRRDGDASGLRILVTGANAGIGFWTSLQLARRGAEVIMACRDSRKAEAAAQAIRAEVPGARLRMTTLDVSSLGSVATAVAELGRLEHLDVLIANAGMVHAPRTRRQSVDGLELVAATNFFGHFALVAGLLPVLDRTAAARVVTLGSLSTLLVRPHLEDPQLEGNYSSWRAYAQSKIMLQSFAFELDRRLQRTTSTTRALSAHPGYSLSGRTPGIAGVNEPGMFKRILDTLQAPFHPGQGPGCLAGSSGRCGPKCLQHSWTRLLWPPGAGQGRPAQDHPRANHHRFRGCRNHMEGSRIRHRNFPCRLVHESISGEPSRCLMGPEGMAGEPEMTAGIRRPDRGGTDPQECCSSLFRSKTGR